MTISKTKMKKAFDCGEGLLARMLGCHKRFDRIVEQAIKKFQKADMTSSIGGKAEICFCPPSRSRINLNFTTINNIFIVTRDVIGVC